MQISFIIKSDGNSADIKEYAEQKAAKLTRYLSHIEKAEFVLTNSRELSTAELILTPRRGGKIIGKVTNKDPRACIDLVISKMERRLTKLKEKVRMHRKGLAGGTEEETSDPAAGETGGPAGDSENVTDL